MAVRKPMVLNAGELEQLQAGDRIQTPGVFEKLNANAGAINIGQPVYVTAAGSVDLAKADAAATKDVLGLVADTTILAANSGAIQSEGLITATTGEWDAVTGDTGGLTPGSWYYLNEGTAGMLTKTVPSTGWVCKVGQAVSTTELEISIKPTIKL